MEKRDSFMLVLSTAIISGVSIYMNKYAVKGIDSDIFTFSKNILVAIFLFSLIVLTTKTKEIFSLKKQDWLKLILVGFIGGSVPFLLYFKGLQITTATNASLIHKSMFLFVTLFAFFFLKEKLNRKVIFAVLLLFIGNVLLIKPKIGLNNGEILILAATILWAIENIISKQILKDLSGNVVAFGRMFFGSLFLLAYLLVVDKTQTIFNLSVHQTYWILITSGMLLLYVLTWYNGLKHTDVSIATAILLLGSPITALLNYASGTEITIAQATGIFILVIGIITYMNSTKYLSIDELKKLWTQKTKA